MPKLKKIFYFKKPLETIAEINRAKWVKLYKNNSALDASKSYMKASGKVYELSIKTEYKHLKHLDVGQTIKKVEIQSKKYRLVCEDFYLRHHSPPMFGATLTFFYSKGYSLKKGYYYKLLIPLSSKHDMIRELERTNYSSDGKYIKDSTEAIINNDTLFIHIIKDERLGYFLSIESKQKQTFDVFSEKAHAAKNGFGYLTGYLAGNKGYYFAYGNNNMDTPKHFYICGFRDELISHYTPIHSNPYGYIRHRSKLASKLIKDPTLRVVKISEFSTLCQRLHDSLEFSVVILLILESSKASLLFMPGGFAIALETISDIIGKTKERLAPIKSKALSKIVRKECAGVVKKHCSTLDAVDLTVLLTRIEQLNQTTNKARLKAPFDKLKIELLQADLDILDTRNDFLHGRIPDISKDGKEKSTSTVNKELYYASIRFYTLLNILILKWIGFDGRVVNYPKINEKYTKIKLEEDYFRLIKTFPVI